MDRSRTMPRLTLILSAALTLAGVAVRSLCVLTAYDPEVGYFDRGFLPTLSTILYFLAVIALSTTALLIPKGTCATELTTRYRFPATLAVGLSLVAFSAAGLILRYPDVTAGTATAMALAPVLLGLLASLYFFFSGRRDGRYPDGLSASGFLSVFWCVAAVAETYSDMNTAMNSPIKLGLQLGFLGFMLILLAELRFRLGKALPRGAVAFLAIGSYACLTGSIPVLLGMGAGTLTETFHLLYAVVLLCAGLYGLFVLAQYLLAPAAEADAAPETDSTPDTPAEPLDIPTESDSL